MALQALRGQWNFTGYITSDSDAINNIWAQHKYVQTAQEASCVAIVNGTTDINSGTVSQSKGHLSLYLHIGRLAFM